MATYLRNWQPPSAILAIGLLLLSGLGWAAERNKAAKAGQFNSDDETVEMFQAIDKGDIAVRLIPKDSAQGRVMIENKTNKPLNVKLPEAFGAVPVLAQGAAAGGGGRGAAQPVGGGMMGGGGGGMMGGGGMGMGMMNIPPEKVGQLKVNTVCLEHGKPEPRASIPYEVKPLESVTNKPGVREVCAMVGRGDIPQRAAQVAAWHLNNNMSFEQLAAKQLRFADGTSQPYFSPQELQAGLQITARATQLAQQRTKSSSSSEGGPASAQ